LGSAVGSAGSESATGSCYLPVLGSHGSWCRASARFARFGVKYCVAIPEHARENPSCWLHLSSPPINSSALAASKIPSSQASNCATGATSIRCVAQTKWQGSTIDFAGSGAPRRGRILTDEAGVWLLGSAVGSAGSHDLKCRLRLPASSVNVVRDGADLMVVALYVDETSG